NLAQNVCLIASPTARAVPGVAKPNLLGSRRPPPRLGSEPIHVLPKCEASSHFCWDRKEKTWQIRKGSPYAIAWQDRQTTPAGCGGGPSEPPPIREPRS